MIQFFFVVLLRYPISTSSLYQTNDSVRLTHIKQRRAKKKVLSYIIIFAFRDTEILLKRERGKMKKRELNFSIVYALAVEKHKGDDDNLLIFHFTPMHASQRCALRAILSVRTNVYGFSRATIARRRRR